MRVRALKSPSVEIKKKENRNPSPETPDLSPPLETVDRCLHPGHHRPDRHRRCQGHGGRQVWAIVIEIVVVAVNVIVVIVVVEEGGGLWIYAGEDRRPQNRVARATDERFLHPSLHG